jgi:CRP-like cAMP-binding protein
VVRRRDGKLDLLRAVPLFRGCSERELRMIGRIADSLECDEGTVLTEEGAPGHECFVIGTGTADVTIGDALVMTLGPGGFFGEMALLDKGPRTATVTARTPMSLYVLDARALATLLVEAPTVARTLLVTLAARLRLAEAAPTH